MIVLESPLKYSTSAI